MAVQTRRISPALGVTRERHGIGRSSPAHSTEDLYRRVNLLEDILLAGISFGVPKTIDAIGAAAGAKIGNMRGVWVEKVVTALGTNTFTHTLGLANPTGVLNVRWLLFGPQHDGTAAGTGDTIDVIYQGGTVTGDAIDLYVTASGARTVSGAHPLTLTLFFVPADG